MTHTARLNSNRPVRWQPLVQLDQPEVESLLDTLQPSNPLRIRLMVAMEQACAQAERLNAIDRHGVAPNLEKDADEYEQDKSAGWRWLNGIWTAPDSPTL
jgi:hypothetical protein